MQARRTRSPNENSQQKLDPKTIQKGKDPNEQAGYKQETTRHKTHQGTMIQHRLNIKQGWNIKQVDHIKVKQQNRKQN